MIEEHIEIEHKNIVNFVFLFCIDGFYVPDTARRLRLEKIKLVSLLSRFSGKINTKAGNQGPVG